VVGVGCVIVGGWGLLVVLLFGLVGVFGGCWCCVGSLLVWSGSGVLSWCGGFCCWGMVDFHFLHCWRLSCVWAVVVWVVRVVFRLLVLVVVLFVGGVVVAVVVVVGVILLCIIGLVVFPSFCFLGVGSSYSGCVGCMASGFGLCRVRLRGEGGGGCGVLVVLLLSSMRWDLRRVMVVAWLGWRFGGGHVFIVSVLRSSFMICLMLRSSSPVRANRRYNWESWCAWVCVWRRTGIAP
jgi:hypothetical protein